jgi:hypothetical protein
MNCIMIFWKKHLHSANSSRLSVSKRKCYHSACIWD